MKFVKVAIAVAVVVLFFVSLKGAGIGFVYDVKLPFDGPAFRVQLNAAAFKIEPSPIEILRG